MAWLKVQNLNSKELEGPWVEAWRPDPYWRVYWNATTGATIHLPAFDLPLNPSTIYVVPAWLPWRGTLEGRVVHTWLQFRTPQWTSALCRQRFTEIVKIPAKSHQGLCMVEIMEAKRRGDLVHACRMEALAHLALGEVLASSPAPQEVIPPLRGVLEHVHQNPAGDLRVDRLARLSGCSAGHLSRLFQQHLGASPAQVVREIRVSHGADRLLNGYDSMEQIADQSGFSNRFHFSRVFREVMGMSPAAFRKHHWATWPKP